MDIVQDFVESIYLIYIYIFLNYFLVKKYNVSSKTQRSWKTKMVFWISNHVIKDIVTLLLRCDLKSYSLKVLKLIKSKMYKENFSVIGNKTGKSTEWKMGFGNLA